MIKDVLVSVFLFGLYLQVQPLKMWVMYPFNGEKWVASVEFSRIHLSYCSSDSFNDCGFIVQFNGLNIIHWHSSFGFLYVFTIFFVYRLKQYYVQCLKKNYFQIIIWLAIFQYIFSHPESIPFVNIHTKGQYLLTIKIFFNV